MSEQIQHADLIVHLNNCETLSEFTVELCKTFSIKQYLISISDLKQQQTFIKATSIQFNSEIEQKDLEETLTSKIHEKESALTEFDWSLFDSNSDHFQFRSETKSFDFIFVSEANEKHKFEAFLPFLKPFAERFLTIDDLEEKITNKSEFLRKAVHDLKNPLSNIIGYLSLLTKYIDNGQLDPDKMKDDVKHIIRIAEHMTKLVTDLLTIASFEAGKINLGFTRVNVFKLIHESLAKVERICQKKNVKLKKSISTIETDIVGEFDLLRLGTAIDELINHALKFTIDGEIEFSAVVIDNHLHITVTDHVHDISAANVTDLFTGFASLHTRTTDGQKPNSFTLLLIKKIVETHHGEVSAVANPEGGASFSIKLPLNQPNA